MRATIKMIAERAGVSIGTVDRVLHDRPYVKEEVRRRVLEVMEELDYQPNRVAETHDNYDEALAAVTAALAEEPDLKYIYMANRSVPACMEALRGAGRMGQVRVLAHDNSPETRTFLREGLLDFIIDQNLTYQSRKALSLLFDAVVEHRTPERDCFYPESPILTAENC